MADSFDFDVNGLEELERDLIKAIRIAPAQAEETLKQLSKDFKASAKKKANSELKHIKRSEDDEKYAIKKNWGSKIVDDGLGMAALIWNKAPHFHLVENGHQLVRGGKLGKGGEVVGFVPGKHIMEKTRNDYKDIVPERFQQMVDDILREGDLD